jgi:hypothetical protein
MGVFSIVTVSIPERHELLARACASVRAQTFGRVPHLIRIEEPDTFSTQHVAHQRNAILPAVHTGWMAVLDDDDTFHPTYLERVATAIAEHPNADVVYTYCEGHPHAEGPFDLERLMRENYIDGEAVIRTDTLRRFGAYPVNAIVEDWQVWKAFAAAGCEFVCVPERLRHHGRAPRNITG